MSAPQYVIFAGVNGAGKSTLFQSGLWVENETDVSLPRINPDEIIQAKGWDWANPSHQLAAGKIALGQIRDNLETRISFNQETTLSGHIAMRNIRKAAEYGYEIRINYVGVESPEIAIERIKHRVELGGHSINAEDVGRRYTASIENLVDIHALCTTIRIFDNTHRLTLAAYSDRETTVEFLHAADDVSWYANVLPRISQE